MGTRIKYTFKVFFAFFVMTNASNVYSQVVEIHSTLLHADSLLTKELYNLLNKEKECPGYDTSLIWSIHIKNQAESKTLLITMQKYINPTYPYAGFFSLSNTIFFVSGTIDGVLNRREEKYIYINKSKIKPKNTIISPEDYSSWIYKIKDGQLIRIQSYPLPCK